MIALLLAATVSALPACNTVQPSPAFVCVGGGWLPPGHPGIPPPSPPKPTVQQPLAPEFQVGKAYRRDATGAEIFIVAIGAGRAGLALYAAECLTESVQDGCLFGGQGRLILANASSSGWSIID